MFARIQRSASALVRTLPILAAVFAAGPVFAQTSVTDNGATFSITLGAATDSWGANLNTPAPGNDQVFEWGLVYRVAGDAGQTILNAPDSAVPTGNQIAASWADAGARGLVSIDVDWTLTGSNGGTSAFLTADITATNLTGAPLDLTLIHYLDLDLQPSIGDDSAVMVPNNVIRVTDPGTNTIDFEAVNPDAFEVRTFGGALDAAIHNTAAVIDLNNTGLPFGPADFTGAFQWNDTIPAMGSVVRKARVGVNNPLPVEVSGFEID